MEYDVKKVINFYEDLTINVGLWNSEMYIFNKYIDKSSRILDVGCGTGRTTFGLYKLGYKDIIGVDLSEKMIDMSRKNSNILKNKITFEKMNVCSLGFDDMSFDCVFFSFNGLMTIPSSNDRIMAVKEISRVLKKDGCFIFTAYDRNTNKKYKKYWIEEKKKWKHHKQDERCEKFGDRICDDCEKGNFIHVPIKKEIKQLCEQFGLKMVYSKLRSKICTECDKVNNLFDDCIFYVMKKEGSNE